MDHLKLTSFLTVVIMSTHHRNSDHPIVDFLLLPSYQSSTIPLLRFFFCSFIGLFRSNITSAWAICLYIRTSVTVATRSQYSPFSTKSSSFLPITSTTRCIYLSHASCIFPTSISPSTFSPPYPFVIECSPDYATRRIQRKRPNPLEKHFENAYKIPKLKILHYFIP